MRWPLIALLLAGCGDRPEGAPRSRGRPQSAADSDRTGGDVSLAERGDAAPADPGRAGDEAPLAGDSTSPTVCGNGHLEPGESCDDGFTSSGCATYHDGGDGLCVPPGTCSPGYVPPGCTPQPPSDTHVHIYVDNFCNLAVDPPVVEVAPTQEWISFDYHNHSVDYAVDVWLSYGGGYLELEPGTSWDDQFDHCRWAGRPYDAYADISISGLGVHDPYCPGHRMLIHCR